MSKEFRAWFSNRYGIRPNEVERIDRTLSLAFEAGRRAGRKEAKPKR
jgi:hypothetical protein